MTQILVIEDEAQTRQLFLKCLAFENFQAFGAENGAQGIAIAKKQSPDLIICDIMMPDMDGYAVLSALHQHQATAAVPFIFLTAKVSMSDLRKGMELGADDYLTKPCTVDQLLSAIATRLKRKQDLSQQYQPLQKTIPTSSHQFTESDSKPPSPASESIFPSCPELNTVFEFIESHYHQTVNLGDVAAVVGYSPAYLTHLMHTRTGKTVKQWIIERRMAAARQLLAHTKASIRKIAEAIGYSDPSYFTRQFRQLNGISPQVWRQQSVTEATDSA